jgi:hypothetical protein
MVNNATRVAECNKKSWGKSYLFEFSGCLHYSFALEIHTFLEIKDVNVSGTYPHRCPPTADLTNKLCP